MLSILNKVRLRPSKGFLIQATTAGALAFAGDAICQLAVEKAETLDVQRSLRFGLIVTCFSAPIQFQWFKLLERRVHSSSKVVTGLKRMALDQAVAAPILTSAFIFVLQLVNGHSVDYALNRLRTNFFPVMTTNYKVWPAVQFLNMSLVPLQYRVVFVNFIAVFWNIYLSSKVASSSE